MPAITRRDAILGAAKLGLVTILAPSAFAQSARDKATGRVTLVLVNDLDRMDEKDGRGGHAKLATVAKAERAKGNALLVHAGDAYSPSLLSGIDKGAHIVELLNRIEPDVFTPGNHEFDFGPEIFRQRVKQSKFDVVAANIHEKDGSLVGGLMPTKIVEIGGFKFGFVGVCTESTVSISSPGDIGFTPAVQTARDFAAKLRAAGAELVVAVTHIGFREDMELVRTGAADIVLSGHDHNLVTYWDGKVVLVESASQADFVTPIDLLIEKTVADGKARIAFVPNFRPIDTLTVAPDPEIAELIKGYQAQVDKELNVPIGTTETALDTRRGALRSEENAFGNLVCDAMLAATGAMVCITNSGGIRGNRDYPAGTTLTRKTILEELPFGNKTVVIELSGKTLRAALEKGLASGGAFPQLGGMTVTADLAQPAGSRILSVNVSAKPLDDAASYTLATNNYLAKGGDGYVMLQEGKTLTDELAGHYVAGQVMSYIEGKGTVAPKVEGRLMLTR